MQVRLSVLEEIRHVVDTVGKQHDLSVVLVGTATDVVPPSTWSCTSAVRFVPTLDSFRAR